MKRHLDVKKTNKSSETDIDKLLEKSTCGRIQSLLIKAFDAICRTRRAKDGHPESSKKWIGVVMLFLLLAGAANMVLLIFDSISSRTERIYITDAAKLRQVFFGGDTWFVTCRTPNSGQRLHPTIKQSLSKIKRFAQLAEMDCHAKLPETNRTIIERFKLNPQVSAFLVANENKPISVPPVLLANVEKLTSFVERNSRRKLKNIEKVGSVRDECFNKERCIIISSRGVLDNKIKAIVDESMKSRNSLPTITINTNRFKVVLSEMLLQLKPSNFQTNALCIINIRDTSQIMGGFMQDNITRSGDLERFMKECRTAHEETQHIKVIDGLPQITNRVSTTTTKKTTQKKEPIPQEEHPFFDKSQSLEEIEL